MNEQKRARKWGWDLEQAPWDRTVAGVILEPILNFMIRACEIIFLAGAFKAAAIATEDANLHFLATLTFIAMNGYIGLGYGRFILLPMLTPPKKEHVVIKLLIVIPLIIVLPVGLNKISTTVSGAANALAQSADLVVLPPEGSTSTL